MSRKTIVLGVGVAIFGLGVGLETAADSVGRDTERNAVGRHWVLFVFCLEPIDVPRWETMGNRIKLFYYFRWKLGTKILAL